MLTRRSSSRIFSGVSASCLMTSSVTRTLRPKRLLIQEHSQTAQASGAEKKEYENQVLSFFLQSLPLRAD